MTWVFLTKKRRDEISYATGPYIINGYEPHEAEVRKLNPRDDWVGLTDDERKELMDKFQNTPRPHYMHNFYATVEEKLKEKNMTHPTKEEAAYATLELYGFTYLGGMQWKPPIGEPPKLKLTDEELYMKAASYATNRKNAYLRGMKAGRCPKKTDDELGWLWVAHVDGYREGYWKATNDTRYTTDIIEEKNSGN